MINLNSAENAHFMLRPDQFQKNCQINAWYYRIHLTNPLRSYNSLVSTQSILPCNWCQIRVLLFFTTALATTTFLINFFFDFFIAVFLCYLFLLLFEIFQIALKMLHIYGSRTEKKFEDMVRLLDALTQNLSLLFSILIIDSCAYILRFCVLKTTKIKIKPLHL